MITELKKFAERHVRAEKTTSKLEIQTNRSFIEFSFIKLYDSLCLHSLEAISLQSREITYAIET